MYFAGIILSFFTHKHEIIYWVDFALLVAGSILAIVAASMYTAIYFKQLKKLKASGILDTLDRYGNPLPVVQEREDSKDVNVEDVKDIDNNAE